MATVEADLPALEVSEVSHLGWVVRANPELKVVSSVAILARECEVEDLRTSRCVTGMSRLTLMVLGIRCRKELTLLLRNVARVVSIVVNVTVSPLRGIVCT